MEKFQELAATISEADRLVRTAPLHNSVPVPDEDLLTRIKDKLSDALSLHGDATKDAKARAKDLAQAAGSDDETAHLALSAPQTPPDAPAIAGDIDHPGPEPGSAPDVAQFGGEAVPAEADPKASPKAKK